MNLPKKINLVQNFRLKICFNELELEFWLPELVGFFRSDDRPSWWQRRPNIRRWNPAGNKLYRRDRSFVNTSERDCKPERDIHSINMRPKWINCSGTALKLLWNCWGAVKAKINGLKERHCMLSPNCSEKPSGMHRQLKEEQQRRRVERVDEGFTWLEQLQRTWPKATSVGPTAIPSLTSFHLIQLNSFIR